MRLIGAGFGRTGTMSLQAALEALGYGPTYHMIELVRDPSMLPLWEAAARGDAVDWTEVFSGWQSTVDWPGATFWPQLIETWPDAPVLLNTRDPGEWYISCLNTIHAVATTPLDQLTGGEIDPSEDVMRFIKKTIWEGTFGGHFLDRDHALGVFRRHHEAVQAAMTDRSKSGRLLVYDVKEGWGPLCSFLGVEVPDTPMPHLNDTGWFRRAAGLADRGALPPWHP